MKRRNADVGKMRRPIKRNKITEGIYGSTLLYLKFVTLWALVILADFILEFRFELLWPFYLLLRSVYDSFRYQGLAFSILFVCVALASDLLAFFFIPVNWLFFAASTYVWVQYVWHTDKGICAPTIVLWVLFVYLETAVRLRDVKHMPGHLDLCRPFAAHCIGYPVVTLGFGFKSFIGFRMRKRKQRDVAKENEFYMQLMQQALPVEATQSPQLEAASNAIVPAPSPVQSKISNVKAHDKNGHIPNGHIANGVHHTTNHGKSHRKSVDKCKEQTDHENSIRHSDRQKQNGLCVSTITEDTSHNQVDPPVEHNRAQTIRRKEKKEHDKEREQNEYIQRLETDVKRIRNDLQNSRASEQELRLQVAALTTSEKVSKGEISALQREIEELQQRIQNLQSSRMSEKQNLSNLERRLADERRTRSNLEAQLSQERKCRKQEEARAAQVAAQTSRECTDSCKARRRELENELNECRTAKHWAEEKYKQVERDNSNLVEKLRDTDVLMSALSTMREKNTHLENSLSAETRIKLDLFSALGEAKRQVEIRESANRAQEKEIEELKSKIAQVLAVMPSDTFAGPAPTSAISRVRLDPGSPGSQLDPNATAYTPKGSLVGSTEA